MRIALAAVRHVNRDISFNLSQMERFMREAARKGADLICFGEAFLQGFDCLDWNYEADRSMAITTAGGSFLTSVHCPVKLESTCSSVSLSEKAVCFILLPR